MLCMDSGGDDDDDDDDDDHDHDHDDDTDNVVNTYSCMFLQPVRQTSKEADF